MTTIKNATTKCAKNSEYSKPTDEANIRNENCVYCSADLQTDHKFQRNANEGNEMKRVKQTIFSYFFFRFAFFFLQVVVVFFFRWYVWWICSHSIIEGWQRARKKSVRMFY